MSIANLIYGIVYLLLICLLTHNQTTAQLSIDKRGLTVSTHDLIVIIGNNKTFIVYPHTPLDQDVNISLVKQHEHLVDFEPIAFQFGRTTINQTIIITGLHPGRLEVTAISDTDEAWITQDLFLRITVAQFDTLVHISLIVGWGYFIIWTISFYPQIYDNWKRKSVVGLNFDMVAYNVVGFTLYNTFNCGLYWIKPVENQYFERYPRGVNPVMLNDVVFSLHSMFATAIIITQCRLFERGSQKITKLAFAIVGVFVAFIIMAIGLASGNIIEWLTFFYWCSYVKLTITTFKYVPQALMNYRRKSTVGWSIGSIMMDLIGGLLSMLQMILNAYNYDDWVSIFGDPTKFGMGLLSVFFDAFFMIQHYFFYRDARKFPTSTKESGILDS